MIPGDIVFVVQQKEHDSFVRKGDDLVMQHKLKLVEALCGCQFLVEHLDGRKLLVKTDPGEVIRPGDVKVVLDEGMPVYKNPFVKGKLFIRFDVEFPSPRELDAAAREV